MNSTPQVDIAVIQSTPVKVLLGAAIVADLSKTLHAVVTFTENAPIVAFVVGVKQGDRVITRWRQTLAAAVEVYNAE